MTHPVWLALAMVAWISPVASTDDAQPYVAETVAGWQEAPVYLSPDSGALTAEQADALADRITGWRDDVWIAVVPAAALGGDHRPAAALDFLDAVHDHVGADGVYVVSFSGAATYGAAWGTDDRIGGIVADQVHSHTRSQVDRILTGILDDLGAPGGSGTGTGWLLPVAVLLVVGATSAVGLVVWRRRRPRRTVLSSGETWGGRADFRPSYEVYADETETVEQRAAHAREDVTRLGEEIQAEDLPTTDRAVAAHVQAGLDAYYDASRRVDRLRTDAELREIGEVLEYARWRLACARAELAGEPAPPRRVACFRDPAHGPSVTDVRWAPPGGAKRPIPVCRSCFALLGGDAR